MYNYLYWYCIYSYLVASFVVGLMREEWTLKLRLLWWAISPIWGVLWTLCTLSQILEPWTRAAISYLLKGAKAIVEKR